MRMAALIIAIFLVATVVRASWPVYWPLTTNGTLATPTWQILDDLIDGANERCLATWRYTTVTTNGSGVVSTNIVFWVNPIAYTYSMPVSTGLAISGTQTNSSGGTNSYITTNYVVAVTNLPCTNLTCVTLTGTIITNTWYNHQAIFAQVESKCAELLPYYVESGAASNYVDWYTAQGTNAPGNPPAWNTKSNFFRQTGLGHQWAATNGNSFAAWMILPQRLLGEQLLGEFQIYSTNSYFTNGATWNQLTTRFVDVPAINIAYAPVTAWSNNYAGTIQYEIVNPHTGGNQSIAGATFTVSGWVRAWRKPAINAPGSFLTNVTFQYVGGDAGTAYNVNLYDLTGGSSSFHINESSASTHPCNGAVIRIFWSLPYTSYGNGLTYRQTPEVFNERYHAINALRYTWLHTVQVYTGEWASSFIEADYVTTINSSKQWAANTYSNLGNSFFGVGADATIYAAFDTQTVYRSFLTHLAFKLQVQDVSPYITNKTIKTFLIAKKPTTSSSFNYTNSEFDTVSDGFIEGLNALDVLTASGTQAIWKSTTQWGTVGNVPTWPADPTVLTNASMDSISRRGYESGGLPALIDWQFSHRDW